MNIRREGDAIVINFTELRQFIWKKRILCEEKNIAAREIITAAEILIAEHGLFKEAGGLDTRALATDINNISLIYTTPFNKVIGNKYGVDIWDKSPQNDRKVFSAIWEPLNIIRFDRGLWIQDLLLSAYHNVIVE